MALANVNIGTERFIDWINRTNQIIQLVNFEESTGYHSNGNIAINGTSTVNGASKFGEANATGNLVVQKAVTIKAGDGQTIAMNVATGLIKGDGGLLTNVRSANLTQNTINVQSNTGTIIFSTGNPALGGQVFLDVRTSQLLSDQSNSNVASAFTANGLDIHIKTVHAQANNIQDVLLPTKANVNTQLTFIATTSFSNGDLLGANSSGLTRIPRGSNGQILTAVGENLQWIDLDPPVVTKLSDEDLLLLYLNYILTTDTTLSQGVAIGFNDSANFLAVGNVSLTACTLGYTANTAQESYHSQANFLTSANLISFTGANTLVTGPGNSYSQGFFINGADADLTANTSGEHGLGRPHLTINYPAPNRYHQRRANAIAGSGGISGGSASNTYNTAVLADIGDTDFSSYFSKWGIEANTQLPVILRYDYGTPVMCKAYSISMSNIAAQNSSPPRDFSIEGSNDNTAWAYVVSVVNNNTYTPFANVNSSSPANVKEFAPIAYRYWRLSITRNSLGNTTHANSSVANNNGGVLVASWGMFQDHSNDYPYLTGYGFGVRGNDQEDTPRGFWIQGSNDYVSWANVHVNGNTSYFGDAYGRGTPYDINWNTGAATPYRRFDNGPATYKYWRFLFTEYPKVGVASNSLYQLFFANSEISHFYAQSVTYTTDSPPDYVSGIINYTKAEMLPYQNIAFGISRDGGTTWSNLDFGLSNTSDRSTLTNQQIRFTNMNLMSQPAGTNVVWKFSFDRLLGGSGSVSERTSINSVILAWGAE